MTLHLAQFATTPSPQPPVGRVLDAVAALPWAAHAAMAIALLAGLVLWASGRHVLKPTIGFCAGAFGALAGLVLLPILAPSAGVSPLVGALAGGVLGLLAGFLLYRVTVGATFGLALGGAVALVTVAVLNSPLAERFAQSSSTSTDNRSGRALAGSPRGMDAPTPAVRLTTTGREAAEFRERSSDFLQSLRYAAEFAWEDIPPARRWWVIGAGAAAAIVGALMGIALPTWAAGLVTALVGAAIWLPAAVWLARAADAPGIDALATLPPTGWAIAWLATASVGLGLQWMGLIKSPAKPAATAAAA